MWLSHFLKRISTPILPVVIAPFILYILPLLSGEALFWGLPVLQFIPWRAYAWQVMSQGMLPLWNPFNGMGAPLIANYQLALFYPPGWLIYLANAVGGVPANAWMQTLLIPFHLALCGAGMALLGKRLGFTALAQTIMGLAFSLSGYFVARAGFYSMIWAGAWLPWILYSISKYSAPITGLNPSKAILFPGLIVCIAMQLLAGHAQLTWYSLVLAGLWVVAGGGLKAGWKGIFRDLGILILNGVIAAGLTAIQLLPTAEYLLLSQRSSAVDAELGLTYSFWPWRILTLLAPGFFGGPSQGNFWGYASFWEDATYIGIVPLFLALSTLSRFFHKTVDDAHSFLIRFCWVILMIASILAMGNNTPVFTWLYQTIPTFSLFNAPARWMFWTVFCLSLLAGVGASAWSRPAGRALRHYKRFTAAALAITIGAVAAWIGLRDIQLSFIEATVMLGIWATGACLIAIRMPKAHEETAFKRWKLIAICWVVLDLVWAGWDGQPFITAKYFQEPASSSAINAGGRVFINDQDEYALKFHRFFRFSDYREIEDWAHLKIASLPNINLLSGYPISMVNNFDPFVPSRFANWMDVVNQMEPEQQLPWLNLMNVEIQFLRAVDQTVVEKDRLPAPMPRAWFLEKACATWVPDEKSALQAVKERLADHENGPTKVLVLEGESEPSDLKCEGDSGKMVEFQTDQPNQVVLSVNAGQEGFLFLADTWFPGWMASIDDQPTPIFHANYLFRAVSVPAGQHTVKFVYFPKFFYIGAGISLCGFLFMILWMLLFMHRVKYR